MIIHDLQRNKNNRDFIPYLRKVVESYRAVFFYRIEGWFTAG